MHTSGKEFTGDLGMQRRGHRDTDHIDLAKEIAIIRETSGVVGLRQRLNLFGIDVDNPHQFHLRDLGEDAYMIPPHLTNPHHTRSHRTSLFPPEVHRASPLIATATHLQ